MSPRLLAATLLITTATLAGTTGAAGAAGTPQPEDTTPAQRLSAYVLPSVVYIQATWSAKILDTNGDFYLSDEPITSGSSCTGFVVTPDGYIATAGHCVNPADEKYDIDTRFDVLGAGVDYALANDLYGDNVSDDAMIRYAVRYWKLVSPTSKFGDRVKYPALTVTASWGADVSGLEAEQSKPARVIDRSRFDAGDVALLKVEADGLNAVPLADAPTDTGTDIASIGYPAKVDLAVDDDLTPSLKTGTVSSSKTVGSGTTSVYEIDAAVAPGMSGGPTVNFDGEVIGVNSFGPPGDVESEAFNFVRPVSLVKEMLGGAGAEASQSPTTKTYVAGLDAYFAGDKRTAVKNLAAVVEEQPANGFASDYLKKARALPDPAPAKTADDSGSVLPWILAGAAVLLLAGLLAFALARRSRAGRGTPPPARGPVDGTGPDTPPSVASPSHLAEPGRPLVGADSGAPQPSGSGPPPRGVHMGAGPSAPAGFGSTPMAPPAGRVITPGGPQPDASDALHAEVAGQAVNQTTDPAAAAAAPRPQFCTTCGAALPASTNFCGECGTKV